MPTTFELRSSAASDFAFCWPIYREAMQPLTEMVTQWNEPAQRRIVELAVADAGTSILKAESGDAGWLQVQETRYVVELKQLYIVPALRNRGLGTSFLTWMKERADRKRKDLTVELTATSPARRLLERLGFKAVPASGGRVTMRY